MSQRESWHSFLKVLLGRAEEAEADLTNAIWLSLHDFGAGSNPVALPLQGASVAPSRINVRHVTSAVS
jgi:hypothetical protein